MVLLPFKLWECCFQTPVELPYRRNTISGNDYQQLQPRSSFEYYETKPTRKQPPSWVDDTLIGFCLKCRERFDVFNRKHHCRACGQVFCAQCSANSEKIVKYGLLEPVRVCGGCLSKVRKENIFYDSYLPMMERGEFFIKQGFISKRAVHLKYLRDREAFQYISTNLESYQSSGKVKTIPLERINDVKELRMESSVTMGISVGTDLHRFDAPSEFVKEQWIKAIECAQDLRNVALLEEKEHLAKHVEQENDDMKRITSEMYEVEQRKLEIQEDRLKRNKEQRELLRKKYKLSSTVSA